MANTKKQLQVSELIDIFNKHPHFTLIQFEKTPHIKMEELRKSLKKSGSSIRVTKNTLLKKAVGKLSQNIKSSQFKELFKMLSHLKEHTALVSFGTDWSEGMHIFFNFSKDEKSLSFRAGCLDSVAYDSNDLLRIAKLPGRNELLATIIGSMKSPLSHFSHALSYNTQKLVYILKTKSQSNG